MTICMYKTYSTAAQFSKFLGKQQNKEYLDLPLQVDCRECHETADTSRSRDQ